MKDAGDSINAQPLGLSSMLSVIEGCWARNFVWRVIVIYIILIQRMSQRCYPPHPLKYETALRRQCDARQPHRAAAAH